MLGIIVQLVLSWLIAWWVCKRNLSVLGFYPTTKRVLSFSLFFLLTAAICSSAFVAKMIIAEQQWLVNPSLTVEFILKGIWWNVRSVLFEELIFRGVLLYILIKKTTPKIAVLISAAAFGIYHWFSFGVFGNPIPMLVVFFVTGLMGLVLAYGYAKTFSLYIPVGIHLGWNITQIFIFSQGPIGDGIFIQKHPQHFSTDSYVVFIAVTFLPIALALLVNFLLIKMQPQVVDTPKVAYTATDI